jgi:hypothetical protein
VLDAITLYDLGYSLNETAEKLAMLRQESPLMSGRRHSAGGFICPTVRD